MHPGIKSGHQLTLSKVIGLKYFKRFKIEIDVMNSMELYMIRDY
jgi:hypothetical protein